MRERPRILFVTRKWAPAVGGMETYSARLAEELDRLTDLRVLSLPGRADGRPPSWLSYVRFALRVMSDRFFQCNDHDVVHVGDMASWPLALPFVLSRRKPRIALSAHGTDVSFALRATPMGRVYCNYQRLGGRLLRKATVIANSHATAQAARVAGWHDVTVVPLATDVDDRAAPIGHDGSILFAGRLIPLKGCGWFVENVLPLLPETMRLRVAGPVWDRAEFARIANHPRVDYLGTLDRTALATAYSNAMCVIAPNIVMANGQFEGFGLVAPEAAAAGGVVVASAAGGLTDAVLYSETGFLAEPGNATAWASRILEIASWGAAKRANFIDCARSRTHEYFSWQRVVTQTAELYNLIGCQTGEQSPTVKATY